MRSTYDLAPPPVWRRGWLRAGNAALALAVIADADQGGPPETGAVDGAAPR